MTLLSSPSVRGMALPLHARGLLTRRTRGRRPGSSDGWRSLVRAVSWHRRLVAAACAAIAVTAGLQVLRPAPPATSPLVVAATGLAGGRLLTAADLVVRASAPDALPDGAYSDPQALVGRRLAAPLGTGEAVTGRRLVGPTLLADYIRELGPGAVVTPVRITDPGALVLLRPGDRVDVLAVPAAGNGADALAEPASGDGSGTGSGSAGPVAGAGRARVVVARAPVLAVEPASPDGGDSGPLGGDAGADGAAAGAGLVVLATTPQAALDLAGATVGSVVSVVVHPSG